MTDAATHSDPNLVLIGLRASGKTTLGRAVAEAEGRPFVDTDDLVLEAAGATSVAEVFRERGEPAFRALERDALVRALGGHGCVVSLGGGTPTAPGAIEVIDRARAGGHAIVVYLHAPADVLAGRLAAVGHDANRPALRSGGDAASEVETLYQERDGLYRSIADRVVDEIPKGAPGVARLTGWTGWSAVAKG
ncbi:MAG: shikimate kinase [Planctomycetota bacterium]